MAYSTATQVRSISGVASGDITDAEIESIITIVDTMIDDEACVSLNSTQKTNASIFLTCATIMERFTSKSLASDSGGGFSLDRLRIDGKSAQTLRMAMYQRFIENYDKILESGTSASELVKKIG